MLLPGEQQVTVGYPTSFQPSVKSQTNYVSESYGPKASEILPKTSQSCLFHVTESNSRHSCWRSSSEFSILGDQSAYLISPAHLSILNTHTPTYIRWTWQETLSWTLTMWPRGSFHLISTSPQSMGFSCLVCEGAQEWLSSVR